MKAFCYLYVILPKLIALNSTKLCLCHSILRNIVKKISILYRIAHILKVPIPRTVIDIHFLSIRSLTFYFSIPIISIRF